MCQALCTWWTVSHYDILRAPFCPECMLVLTDKASGNLDVARSGRDILLVPQPTPFQADPLVSNTPTRYHLYIQSINTTNHHRTGQNIKNTGPFS